MLEQKPGLRALTRASVRDQIAERALLLFDENGFDETTVDDIALAVGISSRSFFRYFAAKEDVVVYDPTPYGALVRDTAEARPADEPVWTVLRHAFGPLQTSTQADVVRALRIMRVMMSTASLRARNLEKHLSWAVMLEPTIAARLSGSDESRRFHAQVAIHSALACLDVALSEWTRRGGSTHIATLLDEAFALRNN